MEAEGIPGPQSSIRKACGACVGLQMSWNGWNTENVAAKVILPQWYAHLLFARYCTKICTRRTYCLVALWRCGSITLHKAFLCTLSRNLILRRLELGLPLLLVRLPPSPHHTHTHTHTHPFCPPLTSNPMQSTVIPQQIPPKWIWTGYHIWPTTNSHWPTGARVENNHLIFLSAGAISF